DLDGRRPRARGRLGQERGERPAFARLRVFRHLRERVRLRRSVPREGQTAPRRVNKKTDPRVRSRRHQYAVLWRRFSATYSSFWDWIDTSKSSRMTFSRCWLASSSGKTMPRKFGVAGEVAASRSRLVWKSLASSASWKSGP